MFRGVAEHMGTIPACAGPTSHTQQIQAAVTDHPRVRGADEPGAVMLVAPAGPSPRARGRLPEPQQGVFYVGTIPACAGPTLVDLGIYPANERFSFSLTQSERGVLIPPPRGVNFRMFRKLSAV